MFVAAKPKSAVVTADGTVPLTPEQIAEQVRTLRLHIPDFGPLPVPESKQLQRSANVDDDLVTAGISVVAASAAVSSALGENSDTMSAARADVIRWRIVEDELRTLLEGVAAGNLLRRYRLGLTVLQAYSISRQLVRREDHADLLPHVDAMRRLTKVGRRKPAEPQTTTTPQQP